VLGCRSNGLIFKYFVMTWQLMATGSSQRVITFSAGVTRWPGGSNLEAKFPISEVYGNFNPHISETVRAKVKRTNNSNRLQIWSLTRFISRGLVKTGSSLLLRLDLVFFDVLTIWIGHNVHVNGVAVVHGFPRNERVYSPYSDCSSLLQ